MSVSRVTESRVFDAPLEKVWKLLRPVTFSFWHAVQSSEVEGGVDSVGSIRKVTFKDGAVQKFRILELSDLDFSVTYEVIESNPPALTLAAYHTLRVRPVTHTNGAFVEFVSEFAAGDKTLAVLEDAKYKRREVLEDLAKALA
ncbi:hypothetical protein HDU97_006985 [Phlyctochytrium planicorne]|nr:hypothetical protein HDU97_006985 [Phlyctochytrium planicorne]